MEYPAPHRTKDDDARHMQGPTGEGELAHLGFSHRIKKELEIPNCPSKRAEQIIPEKGDGRRFPRRPACRCTVGASIGWSGQGVTSAHLVDFMRAQAKGCAGARAGRL